MKFLPAIALLVAIVYSQEASEEQPNAPVAENTLTTLLLSNYSNQSRPVSTVIIYVTLQLKQIISIDDTNQAMVSSFYLTQAWLDPRLTWKPSDHNSTRWLIISTASLWLPDTVIVNALDSDGYLRMNRNSFIRVNYDGWVILTLPVLLVRTKCSLKLRSFPFDKQTCAILISSWMQANNRIDYLVNRNVDLADFTPSYDWNLTGYNSFRYYVMSKNLYERLPGAHLRIELQLSRKSLAMLTNRILPTFIFNVITFLAYFLPYDSQVVFSRSFFIQFFKCTEYH